MLFLIGLGIGDETDVSQKAIDAMKKCGKVYYEKYTSAWNGDISKVEKMAGKTITVLKREDVESNLVVMESKKIDVALLVGGDPLSATTHIELVIEAKKSNVPVEVVHASSVYTAVAESGLQLYKFGRTTTLPKMDKFKPSSPIDVIKENMKSGLHTLVLLDIGMTALEGLKILSQAGVNGNVVACCNLGGKDKIIKYGPVSGMLKDKKLDRTPAVILVPGSLHFKEGEALELWM